MYKQSFSCKINRTEVKYTATKLHMNPDKTDRARSQSLLSFKRETPTPTPHTPLILNILENYAYTHNFCALKNQHL